MHIVIQADAFRVIGITALICIFAVVVSKRIDALDPLKKPSGVLLFIIWLVQTLHDQVNENVGPKITRNLGPYIVSIAIYIFISNISGLFAVDSPTANYSVTLTLAILTWIFQQIATIKSNGWGSYFHGFIEPFFVFLPMNIFGKFSSILSMSMRLFGNVTCGGIIMMLVYSFCQILSNSVVHLFDAAAGTAFNFIGPIVAPILHAYFDLFSAFIQTLIFITLTMVFIGNELPDDIKKQPVSVQSELKPAVKNS